MKKLAVAVVVLIAVSLSVIAFAAPILPRDEKITMKQVAEDAGFLELLRNARVIAKDANPFVDANGEPVGEVDELPVPCVGTMLGGVYGSEGGRTVVARIGQPYVVTGTLVKMTGVKVPLGDGFIHAEYGLTRKGNKVRFAFIGIAGGGTTTQQVSLAKAFNAMVADPQGADFMAFNNAVAKTGTQAQLEALYSKFGFNYDETTGTAVKSKFKKSAPAPKATPTPTARPTWADILSIPPQGWGWLHMLLLVAAIGLAVWGIMTWRGNQLRAKDLLFFAGIAFAIYAIWAGAILIRHAA